jgi:hypothetical protein
MTDAISVALADVAPIELQLVGAEAINVAVVDADVLDLVSIVEEITVTAGDDSIELTLSDTDMISVTLSDAEPISVSIAEPDSIVIDVSEAGAAGSGAWYRHVQSAASDTWTINHPLGYRPAVSLEDSAGSLFCADVTYPDETTVVVHLSAAVGGYANLS